MQNLMILEKKSNNHNLFQKIMIPTVYAGMHAASKYSLHPLQSIFQ